MILVVSPPPHPSCRPPFYGCIVLLKYDGSIFILSQWQLMGLFSCGPGEWWNSKQTFFLRGAKGAPSLWPGPPPPPPPPLVLCGNKRGGRGWWDYNTPGLFHSIKRAAVKIVAPSRSFSALIQSRCWSIETSRCNSTSLTRSWWFCLVLYFF